MAVLPSLSSPADADSDAIAEEFKAYAYSVSHDLSAPVRAMVEFSKLLTAEHAEALNEEGRKYLSIIIENGQKLQAMMDGLLTYSRLNTMAKPFARLDCNRILQDCIVVINGNKTIKGCVLDVSSLPTLYADADQMLQLFMILLDNALKFRAPGHAPRISVSAERQDGMWRFAVSDNGIGIPPQFHTRIFKLFTRLHTDEEYPGVGIGLTLAQKIVRRHRGEIWCESTPGGGATFLFTLPTPE